MSHVIVRWRGPEGNELVGSAFGDPAAPGVLLLHGGGQTRHAWGETGRALAEAGHYAVALDLRGHGESAWPDSGQYSFRAFAGDVRAAVAEFRSKPALVGASLGGLATIFAAGEAPHADVSAVVLVDIAHRMESAGVARIVGFMLANAEEGFATLDEAADAIAAYLPHRERPTDLGGLAKNLRLCEDGRYRWHWDPRFLRPRAGETPQSLADDLRAAVQSFRVPTLLVRGRQSDVLSEEVAREFLTLVPNAEYVDVGDASHMIAGDTNDVFCDAVAAFLTRQRG